MQIDVTERELVTVITVNDIDLHFRNVPVR